MIDGICLSSSVVGCVAITSGIANVESALA